MTDTDDALDRACKMGRGLILVESVILLDGGSNMQKRVRLIQFKKTGSLVYSLDLQH